MGLFKPPCGLDFTRWQNSLMSDLAHFDVAGKRVFLRCDLNVPLKSGIIKDDGRIKASLPTIQALLANGASLVIAAHLGRPKGEAKPELSLAPVAKRLGELLGKEIIFPGAVVGDVVSSAAAALKPGQILLLKTFALAAQRQAKRNQSAQILQQS